MGRAYKDEKGKKSKIELKGDEGLNTFKLRYITVTLFIYEFTVFLPWLFQPEVPTSLSCSWSRGGNDHCVVSLLAATSTGFRTTFPFFFSMQSKCYQLLQPPHSIIPLPSSGS